jgi:hypothetical protein
MFNEANYVDGDELIAVSANEARCVWAGCLYKRKSGGFDLFYDHENSEFKPLSVDVITKLRRLCADQGVFFITHIEGRRADKSLLEDAKGYLLNWIKETIQTAPKTSNE